MEVTNNNHQKEIRFDKNPDFCKTLEMRYGIKVYSVSDPVFLIKDDGSPTLLDAGVSNKEPRLCRSVLLGVIDVEAVMDSMAFHGVEMMEEAIVLLIGDSFAGNVPKTLYGLSIIINAPTMDPLDFISKSRVVLRGYWEGKKGE